MLDVGISIGHDDRNALIGSISIRCNEIDSVGVGDLVRGIAAGDIACSLGNRISIFGAADRVGLHTILPSILPLNERLGNRAKYIVSLDTENTECSEYEENEEIEAHVQFYRILV